jgi:hypothetical protein
VLEQLRCTYHASVRGLRAPAPSLSHLMATTVVYSLPSSGSPAAPNGYTMCVTPGSSARQQRQQQPRSSAMRQAMWLQTAHRAQVFIVYYGVLTLTFPSWRNQHIWLRQHSRHATPALCPYTCQRQAPPQARKDLSVFMGNCIDFHTNSPRHVPPIMVGSTALHVSALPPPPARSARLVSKTHVDC